MKTKQTTKIVLGFSAVLLTMSTFLISCSSSDDSSVSGSIISLNCTETTNTGTLTQGTAASGVSSTVPYTGGNGRNYSAQLVNSTGVTGLTAQLLAGNFASGPGTLTYTITGTPSASGTANFALIIGGQGCILNFTVSAANQYPPNSIFCASGPTAIVEVTNPSTGKIWMNRNLGASQVATSSTDAASYGDLYQWGRRSDGHQCRNSATTTTLSSTDQPAHGDFIIAPNSPFDWRSPQNTNLWQGVNGVNNPCPSGYRLPSDVELNAERLSWASNNAVGAFASPLKLPMAGGRKHTDGTLYNIGSAGFYRASTVNGINSNYLDFKNNESFIFNARKGFGLSVRCIKD